MSAISYYVYENWHRNRGRIHKADCSFCNNGQGVKGGAGDKDEWHGPFEDREAAFVKAASLRRGEMKACGTCDP